MTPSHYIDIQAADGGSFQGYLALPEGAGKAPGIVLIQEIFGVNAHIRSIADAYARDGFAVLAPDVYWRAERGVELGYEQADVERGMALRAQITPEQMVSDLEATAKTLKHLPQCNGRVAAMGYCMGGQLTYRLAATGAVDAGVSYYGARIGTILDQAARIRVPMLFHYGALDHGIPPEEVEAVRQAFTGRDDVTIHVYADADHGFNCDQRASYNADVARVARERSLAFLRKVL